MNGQAMLDRVLPRMAKQEAGSGVSFIDALNTAVGVIASRLWEKRSELVRSTMEVDTDPEPFSLGANFMGLAEDPYAVSAAGQTIGLLPLAPGMRREFHGKTGPPKYYRLQGTKLQLFPAPDLAYTLHGEYFVRPGAMTLSSKTPWEGLFDSVIEDATVRIAVAGETTSILADAGFREVISLSVDSILSSRTNPAPRRSRAYFQ